MSTFNLTRLGSCVVPHPANGNANVSTFGATATDYQVYEVTGTGFTNFSNSGTLPTPTEIAITVDVISKSVFFDNTATQTTATNTVATTVGATQIAFGTAIANTFRGSPISGPGIPAGTIITDVPATGTYALSQPLTAASAIGTTFATRPLRFFCLSVNGQWDDTGWSYFGRGVAIALMLGPTGNWTSGNQATGRGGYKLFTNSGITGPNNFTNDIRDRSWTFSTYNGVANPTYAAQVNWYDVEQYHTVSHAQVRGDWGLCFPVGVSGTINGVTLYSDNSIGSGANLWLGGPTTLAISNATVVGANLITCGARQSLTNVTPLTTISNYFDNTIGGQNISGQFHTAAPYSGSDYVSFFPNGSSGNPLGTRTYSNNKQTGERSSNPRVHNGYSLRSFNGANQIPVATLYPTTFGTTYPGMNKYGFGGATANVAYAEIAFQSSRVWSFTDLNLNAISARVHITDYTSGTAGTADGDRTRLAPTYALNASNVMTVTTPTIAATGTSFTTNAMDIYLYNDVGNVGTSFGNAWTLTVPGGTSLSQGANAGVDIMPRKIYRFRSWGYQPQWVPDDRSASATAANVNPTTTRPIAFPQDTAIKSFTAADEATALGRSITVSQASATQQALVTATTVAAAYDLNEVYEFYQAWMGVDSRRPQNPFSVAGNVLTVNAPVTLSAQISAWAASAGRTSLTTLVSTGAITATVAPTSAMTLSGSSINANGLSLTYNVFNTTITSPLTSGTVVNNTNFLNTTMAINTTGATTWNTTNAGSSTISFNGATGSSNVTIQGNWTGATFITNSVRSYTLAPGATAPTFSTSGSGQWVQSSTMTLNLQFPATVTSTTGTFNFSSSGTQVTVVGINRGFERGMRLFGVTASTGGLVTGLDNLFIAANPVEAGGNTTLTLNRTIGTRAGTLFGTHLSVAQFYKNGTLTAVTPTFTQTTSGTTVTYTQSAVTGDSFSFVGFVNGYRPIVATAVGPAETRNVIATAETQIDFNQTLNTNAVPPTQSDDWAFVIGTSVSGAVPSAGQQRIIVTTPNTPRPTAGGLTNVIASQVDKYMLRRMMENYNLTTVSWWSDMAAGTYADPSSFFTFTQNGTISSSTFSTTRQWRVYKATANNNVVQMALWNTDSGGTTQVYIGVNDVQQDIIFAILSPGNLVQLTSGDQTQIGNAVRTGLSSTLNQIGNGVVNASLLVPASYTPI